MQVQTEGRGLAGADRARWGASNSKTRGEGWQLAPAEFQDHLFTNALSITKHVLHVVILDRVCEL
jgi:hypothetical protein